MNHIRRVLDATGWSQAELGRRLGVHKDTIQDWSQGRSTPRPGVWRDLRRALEAQRADLDGLLAELP